jgi:TolA-binding protein
VLAITMDQAQQQPGRRRRISSELDLAALGNLKSNISSILTSVEKIATGEYAAIDPVRNQEQMKRPPRARRVTGPHLPTSDASQGGEAAETSGETGETANEAAPAAPKPGPRSEREIPLIEQGISAFRDEEWETAQERFIAAAKEAPGDGRPLAWLAWTRHRAPEIDPHKEPVRNKQLLLRAIQLTPSCPDCHYFLGEIYLALGDKGRAGTCFFRAVELRPDHAQAKRQLQRVQQEQKRDSGLFGRLFKK